MDMATTKNGIDYFNQISELRITTNNSGYSPQTKESHVKFFTPNDLSKWRVETFYEKEPETIQWISTFSKDDVLIDVGANVGMYSIYAAASVGVCVIALEPESQNYAFLNNNIYINNLSEKIIAFPLAVMNQERLDVLNLQSWGGAGSLHAAGRPIGFDGKRFDPVFKQGVYSISLDNILKNLNITTNCHLKIDVDGFENLVIDGAASLLRNKFFHSILVEINEELVEHQELVKKIQSFGYSFSRDQVGKSVRKSGHFKGCGNYIFQKTSS